MTWRSLIVEVEARTADALSEALLAHGAAATSVEDALAGTPDERPVFDEPGASSGGWSRARLTALITSDADPAALLAAAASEAGIGEAPPFAIEPLGDRDWVRHTQSQFAPIRIADRLWIVPSWHTPPDVSALNIVLDPGLAFGTGSHPTTRACLRWLERHVFPGARVLDYGCGSGILAIAAMKLGAGAALGIDIDRDALTAARDNAARNNVVVRWIGADEPLDDQADLVVANILASPLKMLASLLARHCRSGGRIILAGILDSQADDVVGAYAEWFDMSRGESEESWTALVGIRR